MALDRTILHLVESKNGVHTINPQLRPCTYIVGKIYNLFARALETGRKASLCRVQIDFIFNDNVPILCYPAISKSPKQLPNYLKITETSVVLIVFNCVSYDVSTYTVTVSFCRST